MARIRSIKPEAFQSETLAEVSVHAERTMFGMSTQADDRGRLADKPPVINGAIWPMRPEHMTADLENELGELEKVNVICRYIGCDGKRYLHLVSWDRHQRVEKPSKSRLPRCPHHLVSSSGVGEECNHDGPCKLPEFSRNIPGGDVEASIRDDSDTPSPAPEGDAEDHPGEPATTSHQGDVDETSSSEPPAMEPPGNLPEASALGSRTLDLGSLKDPASPTAKPFTDGSLFTDLTPSAEANAEPKARYPHEAPKRAWSDAQISADPQWKAFYAAYPYKKEPRKAARAWLAALRRGATADGLVAAANSYRNSPIRTAQYTKYPASWLNADSWQDEETAEPTAAVPAQRPWWEN